MKKLTPVKQHLLSSSLILLILLISVVTVLHLLMKPRLDTGKLTTQIAVEKADLIGTSSVELYNGSEAYCSACGTTSSEGREIASVGEDNGEVYVCPVNDGISHKEAKQAAAIDRATDISKIVYGIHDETPIWRVTATNGYYPVNFETNELMKKGGI